MAKKNQNNKVKKHQLEFVVLIGPPCSGKSTLVKQPKYKDYFIASIDDVMMALHPGYTYNQVYNDEHGCRYCTQLYAEKLFKQLFLSEVRKKERSIIIDKTNLTSKSRKRLLATVPEEYKKIALIFNWDMKVIKERNIKRAKETGKFISEKVLDQMNDMFVPINPDEGFDIVKQVQM